jgi:hypothetical protein
MLQDEEVEYGYQVEKDAEEKTSWGCESWIAREFAAFLLCS